MGRGLFLKEKIDKLDFIKIESATSSRYILQKSPAHVPAQTHVPPGFSGSDVDHHMSLEFRRVSLLALTSIPSPSSVCVGGSHYPVLSQGQMSHPPNWPHLWTSPLWDPLECRQGYLPKTPADPHLVLPVQNQAHISHHSGKALKDLITPVLVLSLSSHSPRLPHSWPDLLPFPKQP